MKTLLWILAGLAIVFLVFRALGRKDDALGLHLYEQRNLDAIGKIAADAQISARPPVATVNSRGLLDGVIVDVFGRETKFNWPTWLPTSFN